jgi:hypothetical protein
MSKITPPRDPYGNNGKRSKWAGNTLKYFGTICKTDKEDLLKDLLCNLMHWADRHEDFEHALDVARMNHYAETKGGEP